MPAPFLHSVSIGDREKPRQYDSHDHGQPHHVVDRETEHEDVQSGGGATLGGPLSVAIERAGGVIAKNVVTASNCQRRNGLRFLGLALPAKSFCDRFCQEWFGFHIVSEPLQVVFRDITKEPPFVLAEWHHDRCFLLAVHVALLVAGGFCCHP